MKFSLMTKKLDDIHILGSKPGGGSTTLCGRPFLGNDYMRNLEYKVIDKNLGRGPRQACLKCLVEANEILNVASPSFKKTIEEMIK